MVSNCSIADGKGSRTIGEVIEQEEHKVDDLKEEIERLNLSKGNEPIPSAAWVDERLNKFKHILEKKTGESVQLLSKVFSRVTLKYKEAVEPKSGYVAHACLD